MSEFFTATPAKQKLNHKQDNEIYAIFSFDTPEVPAESRPPLDIAVAMDVSSSMGGMRIENAKRSLVKLIAHLTDKDRLSIVSFSDVVSNVLEPTFMDRESKATAISLVNQMRTTGCTNLSGGVLRALSFLQTNPLNAVQKCMLFTDGQANVGITRPAGLAETVLAARKGIAISSFGYGQGYNETVLDAVSQGGSLYYMDTPDTILTAFGTELGGLVSTFAQNVEVTLTPSTGVEILEILNDFDVTNNGQSAIVSLDDLLAEQQFHVVTRLKTTACDLTKKAIKLVTAEVRYFNTVTGDNSSSTTALKAQFVTPDSATSVDDPTVMNEVAIEKMVQTQQQATLLANAGDYRGAQALFVSNSDWLESARMDETYGALNTGMSNQFANQATYTTSGGKISGSATRSLKGRKSMSLGKMSAEIGVNLDEMFASATVTDIAESFASSDTTVSATDTTTTTDVASFVKSSTTKNS